MGNEIILLVAQLAVNAALAVPIIYSLVNFSRSRALGSLFPLTLWVLQVITNALLLWEPSSDAGTIITNICLPLLLLAISGNIHER